jgi:hypothetical protein
MRKRKIGFGVESLKDVVDWCKWVEDMGYDIDFGGDVIYEVSRGKACMRQAGQCV